MAGDAFLSAPGHPLWPHGDSYHLPPPPRVTQMTPEEVLLNIVHNLDPQQCSQLLELFCQYKRAFAYSTMEMGSRRVTAPYRYRRCIPCADYP